MWNIPEIPDLKYVFKPPICYQGEYRDGVYHGHGILNINNSSPILEGSFYKGSFVKGKIIYKEGVWYEGRVINRRPSNIGTLVINGIEFKSQAMQLVSPT